MGMNNATDGGKLAIQFQMGRSIGGRVELSLHHMAFKVYHHHMFRAHHVIPYTGGFDHHQLCLGIDGGDVSPGEGDQSVSRQLQIGFTYRFFQCFQHFLSQSFC